MGARRGAKGAGWEQAGTRAGGKGEQAGLEGKDKQVWKQGEKEKQKRTIGRQTWTVGLLKNQYARNGLGRAERQSKGNRHGKWSAWSRLGWAGLGGRSRSGSKAGSKGEQTGRCGEEDEGKQTRMVGRSE